MFPDAIAAACDDDYFTVPVIVVGNAIVQCPAVDPGIHATENGQENEGFECCQGPWVLLGEIATLASVVGQHEKRQRLPGVEDGPLQQFAGYICRKTCKTDQFSLATSIQGGGTQPSRESQADEEGMI